MTLTICYLTNRKTPRIEWFFDTFARECLGVFWGIRCVVVDFYADQPGRREEFAGMAPRGLELVHVQPKPTVWQGPHRLTSRDYFAVANSRNTGLCLAPDGWIAYVDDLSVLMPGWFQSVREGMKQNYVVGGAYKKVLCIEVKGGHLVCHRELVGESKILSVIDSRWDHGSDDGPVRINGGALFGCSLVAPVEAFLKINGWDEDCDNMGMEDCIAGLMLERNGYPIMYDRRMLTYESIEGHREETQLPRENGPQTPHDLLNLVLEGKRITAPNYFPEGGIIEVRKKVLAGEPFPITGQPTRQWWKGPDLSEL